MIHHVSLSTASGADSGAEDAIHLHRAQAAVDDSCPADLVSGLGVRRKNPLRLRIAGGLERDFERLRGDAAGLLRIDANSANVGSDARRQPSQRCDGQPPAAVWPLAAPTAGTAREQPCPARAKANRPHGARRDGSHPIRIMADSIAAAEFASCAILQSGGSRRSSVAFTAGTGICKQVALAGGGNRIDGRMEDRTLLRASAISATPLVKARLDLFSQCRPRGFEQAFLGLGKAQSAPSFPVLYSGRANRCNSSRARVAAT